MLKVLLGSALRATVSLHLCLVAGWGRITWPHKQTNIVPINPLANTIWLCHHCMITLESIEKLNLRNSGHKYLAVEQRTCWDRQKHVYTWFKIRAAWLRTHSQTLMCLFYSIRAPKTCMQVWFGVVYSDDGWSLGLVPESQPGETCEL